MKFRHLIPPAILVGLALPAMAASGLEILPGQYRMITIMTGQTRPTIRFECLSPEDTDLFALPEPGEATRCETTRNAVGSGRIDMARHCTDGEGRASEGSVAGTYADDHFTVQMQMAGDALSAPVEVRSVGQRVAAACVVE